MFRLVDLFVINKMHVLCMKLVFCHLCVCFDNNFPFVTPYLASTMSIIHVLCLHIYLLCIHICNSPN